MQCVRPGGGLILQMQCVRPGGGSSCKCSVRPGGAHPTNAVCAAGVGSSSCKCPFSPGCHFRLCARRPTIIRQPTDSAVPLKPNFATTFSSFESYVILHFVVCRSSIMACLNATFVASLMLLMCALATAATYCPTTSAGVSTTITSVIYSGVAGYQVCVQSSIWGCDIDNGEAEIARRESATAK